MQKDHFEVVLESIDGKFQQMLECFSTLDAKIDRVEERLTDKIELVDAKVLGLAKRVDAVEKRLSGEIAEVRGEIAEVRHDLRAHRENVEQHAVPKKRVLKKVV